MKLSKEEIIKKINDSEIDEDLKISLMEDVSDSFEGGDDTAIKEEFEKTKAELEEKIADLKNRYRERFLAPVDEKEEKEEIKDEEIEEKEVIDVKEI